MYLTELSRHANQAQRIRSQAFQSGLSLSGRKLWTDEEEDVLRDHYPNYVKMMVLLPHRNQNALWRRCQKLRLKKTRRPWLASDVSKLRRLYRTEERSVIMAQLPGRSWFSIKVAASYYGLSKGAYYHRHRRTGKPMIDTILARIEELRWTLGDLDEASGTKGYFRSHSWRQCKPNMKMVHLAVKALGGDLVVKWKDYD